MRKRGSVFLCDLRVLCGSIYPSNADRCADDIDSDNDGNTISDGNWAWQMSNFTDENGLVDIRVLGDTETALT